MPSERRIRNLAIVHLGLGILSGVAAQIELPNLFELDRILPPTGLTHLLITPLFALAMTQAVLLALWGVFSEASPWRSLVGLVVGVGYLEGLMALAVNEEFPGAATVTVVVVSACLLAVKALGVRLVRVSGDAGAGPAPPEGLRFSIQGMMSFTAAVGLISAGARGLRERPDRVLWIALIWALGFVAVGLVCLWAALGEAQPRRRAPFLFVLSPILGACVAHAADAHTAGHFYIHVIMLLFPAMLLGSLLVVRSRGDRLVKGTATAAGKPESPLADVAQHDL